MTEKQRVLRIKRPDEETMEFSIDGVVIGTVDHDEAGWAGMEACENLMRDFAEHLGIKVKSQAY